MIAWRQQWKKNPKWFPLCFISITAPGRSNGSGQRSTPRPQLCPTRGRPGRRSRARGCWAGRPGRVPAPERSGRSRRNQAFRRRRLPRGTGRRGPAGGWRGGREPGAGLAAPPAAAAPSPTPGRKSYLPRWAPAAAGGLSWAGRPGAGRGGGGGRGAAGRGERCSAPPAPPAPSRQPHPRSRPAGADHFPLRQAAPGRARSTGTNSAGCSWRGPGQADGWRLDPARPLAPALRERLSAPPPPARSRPLLAGRAPARNGLGRGVGGFSSQSGARRRQGLGGGEAEESGGRGLRRGELGAGRMGGARGEGGARRPTTIAVVPRPLKLGQGNSYGWKFRKRPLTRDGSRWERRPVVFDSLEKRTILS